jgi:hypothetical protein
MGAERLSQEGPFFSRQNFTRRVFFKAAVVGGAFAELAAARPIAASPVEIAPLPKLITGVNMFNGLYVEGIERDLDEVASMGGSIVRVMVAHRDRSSEESAARLKSFLDKAGRRNIRVIACLINYYGDTKFHCPGMQDCLTEQWKGIPVFGAPLFNNEMHSAYLKLLNEAVSLNKSHPALYAWEPGNELNFPGRPQAVLDFIKAASAKIRSIDTIHHIASGAISSRSSGFTPEQFYGQLPSIDIVTAHIYTPEDFETAKLDFLWARGQSKIAMVEEMGFKGVNRIDLYRESFIKIAASNAQSVLLTGFIAKNSPDNENGDHELGMDAIWHKDYDQLRALVSQVSSNHDTNPVNVI